MRNNHDAGFYASEADFRELIVPFVEDGAAAGEAIILGFDEHKSDLLRSWLSDPSAVTFVAAPDLYATPARAIATYRRLFATRVAAGATRIRVAGEIPQKSNGTRFLGWDRYEWAVNSVWSDFPVHSVCLYDATTVSSQERAVVERTHPRLLRGPGDLRANARYERRFTGLPTTPDPLESTAPLIELTNPAPADARRAVEKAAAGVVPDPILDDLVFGASEAATNAMLYGGPPSSVRIWAAADRVVVHVHDTGRGTTDPLAGLVPVVKETGGLGLWLMHQLDIEVALVTDAHGFTIRLRGGRI